MHFDITVTISQQSWLRPTAERTCKLVDHLAYLIQ